MERCCGQAAMVHADHVNSWWGVELLIPLLKHTKYYYFCELSMCRPMPTREKFFLYSSGKVIETRSPPAGTFAGTTTGRNANVIGGRFNTRQRNVASVREKNFISSPRSVGGNVYPPQKVVDLRSEAQ